MILTLRVDERLIHGQIMATWLKMLDVTNIVVANDSATQDPVLQKVLTMVLPSTTKCLIKSVEDSIRILKDPRGDHLRTLVVTANPQDALTLVQNVPGIPEVNVANYGTMTMSSTDEHRTTVSPMVYLDEQSLDTVRKLIATNLPIFTQKTPSDQKKKLNNL